MELSFDGGDSSVRVIRKYTQKTAKPGVALCRMASMKKVVKY